MPVISTELFKKTFTTAPQTISPAIVSLCREVRPDHAPTWVQVRADRDAIMNECFNNVSAKVARAGGSIVYGWLIWEWSRVFIEAEHHAVGEKDGALLDITPHVNSEPKVLFLADPYIAQANREKLGMSGMDKVVAFDQSYSLEDSTALSDANRAGTSGENRVITLRSNFGKKPA